MIKFRNLTKDEVEVRVGGGNSLLLYKTARVDAEVLDETVGQENWQKKFYQVKNTMICSIGININYADHSKEPFWIWKDDGGDDDGKIRHRRLRHRQSLHQRHRGAGGGADLLHGLHRHRQTAFPALRDGAGRDRVGVRGGPLRGAGGRDRRDAGHVRQRLRPGRGHNRRGGEVQTHHRREDPSRSHRDRARLQRIAYQRIQSCPPDIVQGMRLQGRRLRRNTGRNCRRRSAETAHLLLSGDLQADFHGRFAGRHRAYHRRRSL